MAVPTSPSICSRALYYPYSVSPPVAVYPTSPPQGGGAAALNNVTFTQSSIPADIGGGGVPLPATVVSVSGVAPDYSGMILLVYLPNGQIVPRYANFQSGQPLLNSATWTTNGSNPAQAHWQLVDSLS